jgi:phosphohistidine phosphatase SixA
MQATVPPATSWSVRVIHAETDITRRTAELVQQGIESDAECLEVDVTGSELLRARVAGDAEAVGEDVTKIRDAVSEELEKADVVVVVGHDPSMSWLVHDLVRHQDRRSFSTALRAILSVEHARRWLHAASSLPLRRGEVLMLRVEGTGFRPCWAISPESSVLIGQLQEKIRSKMESAKQLGAFVTALVAFAVTGIHQTDPSGFSELIAWTGTGMVAVAVVAYFATLFRYDSLLMPTTMWASTAPIGDRASTIGVFARPPSSAAWVLYQNMQLIWLRGFTVACALTGAGGALVVVGISEPSSWRGWLLVAGLVAAIIALGSVIWSRTRPVLGVND